MIPLAFSGTFGKLHPPTCAPSGLGVVLVPAHGLEALAAAHSLKRLADHLAAQGHAVLRFDLPGTADALGGDADPDRIACWTEAIVEACERLGTVAGAGRIVLAGHRFGALLAMAAAPRIGGLAGIALIDPILRGRAYARELTLAARAVAEGARLDPDATSTEAGVQVGGHLTTAATLSAMKALDLARLPTPPVPALVLHRRDMPDIGPLHAAWTAASAVAFQPVAGFEGLGLSPTMARTPEAVLDAFAGWLAMLGRPVRGAGTNPPPARLATEAFTEEAVVFGPGNRLFGILCQPARPRPGAPALLMVNPGRTPHVGWARSHVDQARALAAEGHASLRFDLGGIGDSDGHPGTADSIEDVLYSDRSVADARAGLDWLAERTGSPVVVLGACSGAFVALRVAADPRVAGIVLVNIQRFAWRPGETVASAIAGAYPMAGSYIARVRDPRAWTKALTSGKALRVGLGLLRRLMIRLRSFVPSPQTREARALAEGPLGRGARVELVYSQDDPGLAELALHFGTGGHRLTGAPGVAMTVIGAADHDLTPPEARAALRERILAAMRPGP